MDAYANSRIDDLPQIWDGFAKLVRAGLGITAFGVNVMDVPAEYQTRFHDESSSGQEEPTQATVVTPLATTVTEEATVGVRTSILSYEAE